MSVMQIDMPDMPIAGEKVANEISPICTDEKCQNLIAWFNDLSVFREQYVIYQTELKNSYEKNNLQVN